MTNSCNLFVNFFGFFLIFAYVSIRHKNFIHASLNWFELTLILISLIDVPLVCCDVLRMNYMRKQEIRNIRVNCFRQMKSILYYEY